MDQPCNSISGRHRNLFRNALNFLSLCPRNEDQSLRVSLRLQTHNFGQCKARGDSVGNVPCGSDDSSDGVADACPNAQDSGVRHPGSELTCESELDVYRFLNRLFQVTKEESDRFQGERVNVRLMPGRVNRLYCMVEASHSCRSPEPSRCWQGHFWIEKY